MGSQWPPIPHFHNNDTEGKFTMATASLFTTRRPLRTLLAAAALLASAAVNAQQAPPPPPSAQLTAEQQEQMRQVAGAVVQRFQSFLIAFNGNGSMPPDAMAARFTQQVPLAQLQQILSGLRTNVGTCQAVGRMQTNDTATAGYLLNCERGYVPVNLSVEVQPPYRVVGLLIQPTFWK